MGSEAFVLFYGVRYRVDTEEETTLLERSMPEVGVDKTGSIVDIARPIVHPRVRAAVEAGLEWQWGISQNESHYLLIGKNMGWLGWEYEADVAVPTDTLLTMIQDTSARLKQAGITNSPALHAHHEPDF